MCEWPVPRKRLIAEATKSPLQFISLRSGRKQENLFAASAYAPQTAQQIGFFAAWVLVVLHIS